MSDKQKALLAIKELDAQLESIAFERRKHVSRYLKSCGWDVTTEPLSGILFWKHGKSASDIEWAYQLEINGDADRIEGAYDLECKETQVMTTNRDFTLKE